MNAENPFPKRKPTRLAGFDYNNAGAYFITVCTQSRKNLLSHIVGAIHESPVIKLTAYGQILQDILDKIPARFGVLVDQYVIMPNHIHMILVITGDAEWRAIHESPLQERSLISKIVGYLKMNASKRIHDAYGSASVWQRGYHDHIIRNRQDYEEHLRYIYENPMRWYCDELYAEESEE